MSQNYTAYFSDARALLLTECVIVLCVYAAHACSFKIISDYRQCISMNSQQCDCDCELFTHEYYIVWNYN